MKLSGVQAHVKGLILAAPALAALGDPITYSLMLDDEALRTEIASRIRAKGAVIEVGSIASAGPETFDNSQTFMLADFDVLVAESPTVAHTPADLLLVEAVVAAVTARPTPFSKPARLTGYEAGINEHGYVLHVLSFTLSVQLP